MLIKNQRKSGWAKTSAIFLLIFFTLSESFSYALPVTVQPQALIPSAWGTIEKQLSGSTGKTIYLIEDAHDSMEAQKNIAKMIARLVENIAQAAEGSNSRAMRNSERAQNLQRLAADLQAQLARFTT
jgi:hypothetical protein